MLNQFDQLVRGIKRLEYKHGCFKWDASFEDIVLIISQVQLALRHPSNNGTNAVRARAILDAWLSKIDASEPMVAMILRAGFEPQNDPENSDKTGA